MSDAKDVVAELAIFPLDQGESVAAYVAKAVRVIENSGLTYQLGPMATTVEGPWHEVWKVVDACFKALADEADRLIVNFRADFRKGREGRLQSKVESVRREMAQ
jgi:uncharacterized protein (TIGR00106 family)